MPLGGISQGTLFTEMMERERSGQRPEEKRRLGEGYLTQHEGGEAEGRQQGGRLAAWGCSVKVKRGRSCLRTKYTTGLIFAVFFDF